ncbi:MAG: hypothetical protein ABFD00_10580 [Chloroherpetonaceae bacterium]
MSQVIKNLASGPVPPAVATSYPTDINSPAIPAANVLNVVGGTVTTDNDNGIQTDGSSGSNTLTVQLTNRAVGTTTTVGAVTAAVITFPLGAIPGVYTFDITIAGYASAGIGSPLGCGFTIVGSVRTDGAAATLIPTQVVDHFEEGTLGAAPQVTAALAVSGNNALVNVTGKTDGAAGFTINWKASLIYTLAT